MFRLEKIFQQNDLLFINILIFLKSFIVYLSIYIFSILEFHSIYDLSKMNIYIKSNYFYFSFYFSIFYLFSSFILNRGNKYIVNSTYFLLNDILPLFITIPICALIFFIFKIDFSININILLILILIFINLFLIKIVFDQIYNKLLSEKSNLNPVSHYARIKIMSEKALLSSASNYFKPTIVRLGTVFGPSKRMRFDLVVNTMSKFAYFNDKIDVNGGDQWRPNIHVEDVADGIISIIKSKKKNVENQIFNLSNDKLNLKIIEIAKKVKNTFKNADLNVKKTSIDPRNYKVTSKKMKNKTGFVAKKSIEDALKEIKDMFRFKKIKNPDNKIYNNFLSLK